MNKNKIFLIPIVAFNLFLFACGPAAEDRKNMHARAKVFQDSIANSIRSTMAEAESPAPMPINTNTAPVATGTAK